MSNLDIDNYIDNIIKNHPVVLFMKGTQEFPQCGFSSSVVDILNKLNVAFHAVNVMENMDIRQGIKTYSDWPTIPQLYIKGEFIGGCDIVKELYANGELAAMVQ